MLKVVFLMGLSQAQQNLCHGYTQNLPITIQPQTSPANTVNTICFKSFGFDDDAVYWLLAQNMYTDPSKPDRIYLDKVGIKLNGAFEPQEQFSMGKPMLKLYDNALGIFMSYNMECGMDVSNHQKSFAVFDAKDFQITFASVEGPGEITQNTHALTNVILNGVEYISSSDLTLSGVYKDDIFYVSLTLYGQLDDGITFTPALVAWQNDGSVKHFISFGRFEGRFDVANDMILNNGGDHLYVATTYMKDYTNDERSGTGLYPVLSRYNINTGEQKYQYEEDYDAQQEYMMMALSTNGGKVMICTEVDMGYQIEIIYASMSIFDDYVPEYQFFDFYESVPRSRRLREDTDIFDSIQAKTDNALSKQTNARPLQCTGVFISGNGQKGGMFYVKNDRTAGTVEHKILFSVDLTQSKMYEQIIEYKNHDNLYFVVPKSGVYNVRQNYFTFVISQQYTNLNFGENLYSSVIMNSKLVDQDSCETLTDQLVFTDEREFENSDWRKIDTIYVISNLEESSNVSYEIARDIFTGEFDESDLPFNDLSFDSSDKYPLKFYSMCYEGDIPTPGEDGGDLTQLELLEEYFTEEIWSNEVKTFGHLPLQGECGVPLTTVNYLAIISPEDPCVTYSDTTYRVTFDNCPPEEYAVTFQALFDDDTNLNSEFFVVKVNQWIENESPVFDADLAPHIYCKWQETYECGLTVSVSDPNEVHGDTLILEYKIKELTSEYIMLTDLESSAKAMEHFDSHSVDQSEASLVEDPDDQFKLKALFAYPEGFDRKVGNYYVVRLRYRDTFRDTDTKRTEYQYFFLFNVPDIVMEGGFVKEDGSLYTGGEIVETVESPLGASYTFELPKFRTQSYLGNTFKVSVTLEGDHLGTAATANLLENETFRTYKDGFGINQDRIYLQPYEFETASIRVTGYYPKGSYNFTVFMEQEANLLFPGDFTINSQSEKRVLLELQVLVDNIPPEFASSFGNAVYDTYFGDKWFYDLPGVQDVNLADELSIKFEGLPEFAMLFEKSTEEDTTDAELLDFSEFFVIEREKDYYFKFMTSNETELTSYQIDVTLQDDDSIGEGVIESQTAQFWITFKRYVPPPPKPPKVVVIPDFIDYEDCKKGEFPALTTLKYDQSVEIEATIYSEHHMKFECSTFFFSYLIEEQPEEAQKFKIQENFRSITFNPMSRQASIGSYKIQAYIYNENDPEKTLTLFSQFEIRVEGYDEPEPTLEGIVMPKGEDFKGLVSIGEVSQGLYFELEFQKEVVFVRKDQNLDLIQYRNLEEEEEQMDVTIDVWLENKNVQSQTSPKTFSGYKIEQKSLRKLQIQLHSDALIQLSQALNLDLVIVEITNNKFNPWTNLDTFKTLILKSQIPRVPEKGEKTVLEAFSVILIAILLIVFVLTLGYQLVIQKSNCYLQIYFFLAFQYICSFQDLQVVLPKNLKLLMKDITMLLYFIPQSFSFGEFSSDNTRISETGTRINLLQGKGLLILILIFTACATIIPRFYAKIPLQKVQNYQGVMILFSYLVLTTASLRNLFYFGTSGGSQVFSGFISIPASIILISFPFIMFLIYANQIYGFEIKWLNRMKHLKQNFLDLENSFSKQDLDQQKMLLPTFLCHRIVYLTVREAFYTSPSLLIGFSILNQALFVARLLRYQPFSDDIVKKYTILLSEGFILILMYFVASFSEGQPSQSIRYETAKAFIFMLYFYMTIAVLSMISDSFFKKKIQEKLKLYIIDIHPQGYRDADYEKSSDLGSRKFQYAYKQDDISQKQEIHDIYKKKESENEEQGEDEQEEENFQPDRLYSKRSQQQIPIKVENKEGKTLIYHSNYQKSGTENNELNTKGGVGQLFATNSLEEVGSSVKLKQVNTSEYPESYGDSYSNPQNQAKKQKQEEVKEEEEEESSEERSSKGESDEKKESKLQISKEAQSDSEQGEEKESDAEEKESEEEQSDREISEEQQEEGKSTVFSPSSEDEEESSKEQDPTEEQTSDKAESSDPEETKSEPEETKSEVEDSRQEETESQAKQTSEKGSDQSSQQQSRSDDEPSDQASSDGVVSSGGASSDAS